MLDLLKADSLPSEPPKKPSWMILHCKPRASNCLHTLCKTLLTSVLLWNSGHEFLKKFVACKLKLKKKKTFWFEGLTDSYSVKKKRGGGGESWMNAELKEVKILYMPCPLPQITASCKWCMKWQSQPNAQEEYKYCSEITTVRYYLLEFSA